MASGNATKATAKGPIPLWGLMVLGLTAGYLSGLFGVGGGIIVVPALVLLGIDQRRAAGSSVAAILPTAIVGATSYGIAGHVDWVAGAILAAGIIGGAQIGSYLLSRLPRSVLFWIFIVFMAGVVISLWIVIPDRGDTISIDGWAVAGLAALGVLTGILSGILGVGGGIIVVPALMLLFGAGDLNAKGTSLLMMIPGSLSGTIGNVRRKNFDMRVAATVGITACIASPLGLLTATNITPLASNIAFSVLIVAVTTQLIVKHLRARRKTSEAS
ncbi:sulfite exporter TauE/SafE family protein [Microbacterium sp. LTA6]|uniref:sulfite exporter TauE/SafE family protein n=1 Tax=unclassified Microbacterium TaxID=2609290 RepID=UPI0031391B8B